MARMVIEGQDKLFEAMQRVGMVMGACARLEHSVAYLEWQLIAYSWDKDNPKASENERQIALRGERECRNKFAPLKQRLKATSKAFEAFHVAERIREDRQLQSLQQQWPGLRERAERLGEKRNMIGHTSLWWSAGQVLRQIGRPWNENIPVNEEEDNALSNDLHNLAHEIGTITTQLGTLLPFADHDLIIV